MNPGTRVRMSEEFKRRSRGQCQGPGKHVGDGPAWEGDPEMPDDGCTACSWSHIEEFGECEGVVEGPAFPTLAGCDFVDVRWQPTNLRYMYRKRDLVRL